jgi:hypothetical protein
MANRIALAILAVALLFSAFVRWRLSELPLERDEGGMAYMGQLLLHGTPPYQQAYHEKLPGIYLAYAASMAVFGETAAGIHLGLLVVNLATIVFVFFLAKDLFGALAGGMAAAAYSLLAVSPSVQGSAAHATHFVAFFGVAATWALWRALRSDKLSLLFVSGFLFGTAFLMKQHGVFLSGFGALMVMIHYAGRRPFSWRKLLAVSAVFALGAILPYAATCLWMWQAAVFDRFWFWTFGYSRSHVVEISLREGAQVFWQSFTFVAAPNWPLWVAALAGVLLAGWAPSDRKAGWFVGAYFAFSFLCLCPGFFFRPHYFIVLLPPVAVFSGAACARLLRFAAGWPSAGRANEGPRQSSLAQVRRKDRKAREQPVSMPPSPAAAPAILLWPAIGLLLTAGIFMVWQQRAFYFLWTPVQACRQMYSGNPFAESAVIADYLSRHSTPDQRVAVIGSEPQIYFYAKRNAATGHIYAYPLVERQPYAPQFQQEMCREIEATKPEFLVFVHVAVSWLAEPDCNRFIYQWAEHYIDRHYRPVGLVDMLSPATTDYQWGEQAARAHPHSSQYVWIFQRKK